MTLEDIKNVAEIIAFMATPLGILFNIYKTHLTQMNVEKIEIATNSMQTQLVASTERAAGLAGEVRGAQAERERQAEGYC